MRKSLIVFLLSFFAIFGLSLGMQKVNAEDSELAGKVIVHFQKWDNDYDTAGVWTWGTGSGGSVDNVIQSRVDDFGAVIEINVATNASDNIGFKTIKKNINEDDRWTYESSKDDVNVNVKSIKDGTVDEIHVYIFEGSSERFVSSSDKANVFIVYYEPTSNYESELGLHSWGFDEGMNASAWGTPLKIFKDGMKSPGGVTGKVAHLTYTPGAASDTGALVYAGADATKKHASFGDLKEGTISGFNNLKAGESLVIYVSGNEVYVGENAKENFTEIAFSFDFQGFSKGTLSGTFAKNPTTIFAKTTIAVKSQEVTGKEEVTVSVRKERIFFVQDPNGWKLPTDLPTFDSYEASALPAGMKGKVVVHFQKWDGDYRGTGLWTWGTGTSGSKDAVAHSGVDAFGAVMEINIASDASGFGFKTILKNLGQDDMWDHASSKDDVKPDISTILDGTVTEIHVYIFEGSSEFFVASQTNANVLVVYHDQNGRYEEDINIYSWGTTDAPEWNELGTEFKNGMKSPNGIQGKVGMLHYAPGANPGIIIRNGFGDDTVKLHPNDIKEENLDGISDLTAGQVFVVYVVNEVVYDDRIDFAPPAFGGKIVVEYYYVDEVQEIDVYSPVDLSEYFVLKQGTTIIPIETINYNTTATSTNQFVIQLTEANKLDPSKTYTLDFNNGKLGDDLLEATIGIDMDKEAPVINFPDAEDGEKLTIRIPLGSSWDNNLYPIIRVTDDRDKNNLEEFVYVVKDKGTLDTRKVGVYPVTLQVEDEWGNVGEATFNFEVFYEKKGCGGEVASIFVGTGLLGLAFVFKRRRAA